MAGIHPHDAQATTKLDSKLAWKAEVVAIGPCGLDFRNAYAPKRTIQVKCFQGQVAQAAEAQLPLVIVDMDATQTIAEVRNLN
jgi:Tat protein secretion system quality control protein TatD with DNase activity